MIVLPIVMLVGSGPGIVWLEALSESQWALEYDLAVSAKEASVYYSGLLPDPLLRVSVAGSPVETRNGPAYGAVGLQQKIPWPGLLHSFRNRAEAALSVTEANREILRMQKRTQIAILWAEVYRRAQRRRIARGNAVYMSSLLESASGSSPTLLLEQSTLADFRIRTALAEQQPTLEEQSFNASLKKLEAYSGISISGISSIPSPDWFRNRVANAEVNPPVLATAVAAVRAAEADLSAITALRMPGFEIGGSYSPVGLPEVEGGAVSPGRDSWMISVGISLPLGYSGYDARRQEAEFALEESRTHLQQLRGEVSAELSLRKVTVENNADELTLLQELLPVSESAVISASRSWLSGRGTYGTLISLIQSKLEIQMTIVEKEALLIGSTAAWLELAGAETGEGEFL
jgi:hypothetical protein